jgi:hypothetical protein
VNEWLKSGCDMVKTISTKELLVLRMKGSKKNDSLLKTWIGCAFDFIAGSQQKIRLRRLVDKSNPTFRKICYDTLREANHNHIICTLLRVALHSLT